MKVRAPRLMIAGTTSGVGKTTFMAGLCRALSARGLRVATFKCGPDYLDPTHHARASGRTCHNLDGYMMGHEGVLQTFTRNARGADISLIEGMMGLYDGSSPTKLDGSSAELALWLSAPTLLMADASAMARSLAALVHGFASFEPNVNVAGVIANRVAGPGHRSLLEAACNKVPLLGALQLDATHVLKERHLGLHRARGAGHDAWLDAWADHVAAQCNIERLLQLASNAPELEYEDEGDVKAAPRTRIAVAYDEAFHFYYDDNLRALEAEGAKLVFFSPCKDKALPNVDGVYIGGGYPELHAPALSQNASMLASLRAFAASGRPVYAECGGLMYLARAIVDIDGKRHPMLGLIDGVAVMHDRIQAIGYVDVELCASSILGPQGRRARGHLFRASNLVEVATPSRYALRTPTSGAQIIGYEGYGSGSVLASYVHLHFASNPGLARSLVDACAGEA